ncbi:MAG: hypothetical protein OXF74_10585 [Rhodobacteraceae bacterium]|nr:hypothetical protein [Paracoccaceae bacterium]
MSTTGISSWAVDLADVGAIYPFQGAEFLMLIIGLVFWIWWHITTFRSELTLHEEKVSNFGTAENISSAIESD